MTRKYPLDPLRRVRAENADQKSRALSEAVRRLEDARREAEHRELVKHEMERALDATADAERQRLERGELTAADVARGAAWSVAADMERASLARFVASARDDHAKALAQSDEKRTAFAKARTSVDLVERHHREWERAREGELAAKDQESAEEAHLARAIRRGVT